MAVDKLKVKEAEAALAALEKPRHEVARANIALKRAESDGDPDAIKTALARHTAAVQAMEAANISQRDIERAAQAVLDASEEGHTETNILPEHHGVREVLAQNALATALSAARSQGASDDRIEALPGIIASRKDVTDAIALDAAEKAEHVAAGNARTIAAIEGGN